MVKKAQRTRTKSPLLSSAKVYRVLELVGGRKLVEDFQQRWAEIGSQRVRSLVEPTAEQISAVDAFMETGDVAALAKRLSTHNHAAALAWVGRVASYKIRRANVRPDEARGRYRP